MNGGEIAINYYTCYTKYSPFAHQVPHQLPMLHYPVLNIDLVVLIPREGRDNRDITNPLPFFFKEVVP